MKGEQQVRKKDVQNEKRHRPQTTPKETCWSNNQNSSHADFKATWKWAVTKTLVICFI